MLPRHSRTSDGNDVIKIARGLNPFWKHFLIASCKITSCIPTAHRVPSCGVDDTTVCKGRKHSNVPHACLWDRTYHACDMRTTMTGIAVRKVNIAAYPQKVTYR